MRSVVLSGSSPEDRRLERALSLICRVGKRFVALPLEHVAETMRLLPLEAIAGTPSFVLGVSIVRGAPVPVVHAARLLGGESQDAAPARLVTMRIGLRLAAIAVDAVVAVRALATESLVELPPLLREAGEETIAAIGTLDSELLMVLRAARLVPDSVWSSIAARADA